MNNTEIVTYRARNRRIHERKMKQKLRAIQRRHPDARIVSVDVSRRSALQWAPAQLDVTMVIDWGNTPGGSEAAFVGGSSTSASPSDGMLGAGVAGDLITRVLKASVAKFKSLSPRNKALVVGGFVVLIVIGSLLPEEETTPTPASTTSDSSPSSSVTSASTFDTDDCSDRIETWTEAADQTVDLINSTQSFASEVSKYELRTTAESGITSGETLIRQCSVALGPSGVSSVQTMVSLLKTQRQSLCLNSATMCQPL